MARGLIAKKPAAPAENEEAQEPPAEAGQEAAAPGGGETSESPDGQQATPEEQAAYENFIKMALDVIYAGGKVNQQILDRLALRTEGEDESTQAITALASVSVAVVSRVQDSIKQGGGTIAPAVMYHAASEVMGDLAELAGKPNPKTGEPTHDYTEEEIKGAWLRAVDMYQQQQTASGDLPKGAMQHDWGEIVGAAKAGNLAAISPELAQAGGKGAQA